MIALRGKATRSIAAIASALFLSSFAGPANASTALEYGIYAFEFYATDTSGDWLDLKGQFWTAALPSITDPTYGNGYNITKASGTATSNNCALLGCSPALVLVNNPNAPYPATDSSSGVSLTYDNVYYPLFGTNGTFDSYGLLLERGYELIGEPNTEWLISDPSISIATKGESLITIDNITINITPVATPLPAALPLFATGLGAMGLLGWRRKRKAAAVAT